MIKNMRKFLTFIIILSSFLLLPLYAHGPTRQQVVESVVINVSVDKAWELVGDFSALHKWHPAIQSTEMKGEDLRILTLSPDKKITEKLVKRDVEKKKIKYKITDMTTLETFEFAGRKIERKVLPVNTYTGFLSVIAEGEGSKVTWKGKFYRPYLLNPPTPEGMSDKDATGTISKIYRAGLDNLKKILEEANKISASAPKPNSLKKPEKPTPPVAPKTPESVVIAMDASKSTPSKTGFDPSNPYKSHIKCDEGKKCKVDKFLIKGFRTFSQCQVCHGLDGNGSTIAPSLMDKLKNEVDYKTFLDRITNGFKGQIGVMPSWKNNPNIMKNKENLYAYLKARSDGIIPAGRLKKFKH